MWTYQCESRSTRQQKKELSHFLFSIFYFPFSTFPLRFAVCCNAADYLRVQQTVRLPLPDPRSSGWRELWLSGSSHLSGSKVHIIRRFAGYARISVPPHCCKPAPLFSPLRSRLLQHSASAAVRHEAAEALPPAPHRRAARLRAAHPGAAHPGAAGRAPVVVDMAEAKGAAEAAEARVRPAAAEAAEAAALETAVAVEAPVDIEAEETAADPVAGPAEAGPGRTGTRPACALGLRGSTHQNHVVPTA